MATLEQHILSIDEDEEDNEEHDEEDLEWTFLKLQEFGDFSLTTEPVNGALLDEAKKEIRAVCKKARNILNKRQNKQITLCYGLMSIAMQLTHIRSVFGKNWHEQSKDRIVNID
jgi:hypothetical protein